MPDDPDLIEAKAALRRIMRRRRRALAEATPNAGVQAVAQLPLSIVNEGRAIGAYRAQGSEIDPLLMLEALARLGNTLALPAVTGPSQPLTYRAWRPGDALEPDALGIPSPLDSAPEVFPDLLIMPLLAFDRAGGRLGQGGGHFDRTLARLDAVRPVFALGLAFAGQEVDAVPSGEHDRRLDAILTEIEYIPVRKDV